MYVPAPPPLHALANKTDRNMKQLLSIPLLFATATDALSMADPSTARSFSPVKDFKGGAGVGRLVLDGDGTPSLEQWSCKYDMVLVERLQGRPPADSGLFVPRENLPKLHLCRGELVIYRPSGGTCFFCPFCGTCNYSPSFPDLPP